MAVMPPNIGRICLTVPDLDRAAAFYADVLGFTPVGDAVRCNPDRLALLGLSEGTLQARVMRLGRQRLELLAFDPPGEPYPADSTASDLWFQHCAIVVRDMAAAAGALREAAIHPITQGGPQTLPPNTGGVTAFKFRDPFGHPLELLFLPPTVGDPVWHGAAPAVFEGLDHTAIAVSDVGRGAHFYRSLFGFETGARSLNSGPEQSRLDAIADVTVDVLPLKPRAAPPHLELLGYHAGLRRPRPQDWTPRHQAITRTLVTVDDLAAVLARTALLDGACVLNRGTWDGGEAVVLEDPDGHCLVIRAAT